MRTKNKNLVVILLSAMLLFLFTNALATVSNLRYLEIDDLQVQLSSNSAGVDCRAIVVPASSNRRTVLTATLKKSTNGQTWTYVSSWSASGTTLSGASIDETVSVSHGYQYKLFVTGKVYGADGTLLETAYKNSKSIEY